MSKKVFGFGSLSISFVMGIYCFCKAFSCFRMLSGYSDVVVIPLVEGILFTLISMVLLLASFVGIILLIISMIKGKETRLPSIMALICFAVLLFGLNAVMSYSCISSCIQNGRYISNNDSYGARYTAYYVMAIIENIFALLSIYAVSGIVGILAILSLITFKRKVKKAEETPVLEEQPQEPLQEQN